VFLGPEQRVFFWSQGSASVFGPSKLLHLDLKLVLRRPIEFTAETGKVGSSTKMDG
jgi:hypothetical protein